MSRIKLFTEVVENLRSLADSIQAVIESMADNEFTHTTAQDPLTAESEPADIVVSPEQVRKVLADKSQAGFTKEVRELLLKYGAQKLSLINPRHYPALLKDAEALE